MSLPPVVGFIDMDCFYVAVERARDPRLHGKPCAVVQYNTHDRGMPDLPADANRWRPSTGPNANSMGGIIAVSYEARARGVTRQMMGKEARKVCPEIILVQVPTAFGKADLRIYKAAGDEVVALLAKRADATEKRSVDEVAIDITSEAERLLSERDWASDLVPAARKATHLADSVLSRKAASVSRDDTRRGHDGQQTNGDIDANCSWDSLMQIGFADPIMKRLVAGAVVVEEMRSEIKTQLGFSCSGGVATNKIVAKLGCGLHKPDQQTILFPHAVPLMLRSLPIDRLPGLGGDLGAAVMTQLSVATAGELVQRRIEVLREFPDKGEWILALASGLDSAADPVKDRQLVKSLSNGKTFFGRSQLRSAAEVEHWLREFAGELHQRYREQVQHHGRAPTTIAVHITVGPVQGWRDLKGNAETFRKQQPIALGRQGTVDDIATAAISCFHRWWMAGAGTNFRELVVTSLGMALTKMVAVDGDVPIQSFFGRKPSLADTTTQSRASTGTSQASSSPADAAHSAAIAPSPPAETKSVVSIRDTPLGAFFAKRPSTKPAALPQATMEIAGDAQSVPREPVRPFQGLDAGQVDESILAELPLNIRKEIQDQLRLAKRTRGLPRENEPPCRFGSPPAKRKCRELIEIE